MRDAGVLPSAGVLSLCPARRLIPAEGRPILPQSLRAATVTLLLALLSLLMVPSAALALDVGISPARMEHTVEPGTTLEGSIRVGTHGDAPLDARLYVTDFAIDPTGAFVFLEPGHTAYSAATWITLSAEPVTMIPDQPVTIDYVIRIPEEAEPGGHYAMIFCETHTQDGEGSVVLAGRVGCQVLLTVPGDIVQHVAIGSVEAPPLLFGFGREKVSVSVENDGNVHAIPGGYMNVAGGFPAKDLHFDLDRITLLPGSTHTYEQELHDLPWIGRVRVTADIRYGPRAEEFTVGEVREIEVFVLSWKVLVLAGLVVVGSILAVIGERAARRKRARLRRLRGTRRATPERRRPLGPKPLADAVTVPAVDAEELRHSERRSRRHASRRRGGAHARGHAR
jgi:hypothetical protein